MKHDAASGKIRLCVALALGTALIGMQTPAAGGHPDLQGYWVGEGGPGGRGGGRVRPQPSDAGIAAARGYEQPYDDPAIQCDIANIIFGWTHDQNINAISQSDNTITLKYGYMDFVRTIHLDGVHPRTLTPTRGGHSTGKWVGDTLVVDTVGLAPSVLVPMAGIMLSDKAHIVERFRVESGGATLTRDYVVEDPLYLKQSFSGRDVMRASKDAYVPYDCVELSGDNNKRKDR